MILRGVLEGSDSPPAEGAQKQPEKGIGNIKPADSAFPGMVYLMYFITSSTWGMG